MHIKNEYKISISCPNVKPMFFFTFLYKIFVRQSIEWNLCQHLKGIFFFYFLTENASICQFICRIKRSVNSFPAVCKQPIFMLSEHGDFFVPLVVAMIVINFFFSWSLCYFVQGMAISAVTWDAEPILRPVPVLAWWHLHSADKPRLSCQPCESQECLIHV